MVRTRISPMVNPSGDGLKMACPISAKDTILNAMIIACVWVGDVQVVEVVKVGEVGYEYRGRVNSGKFGELSGR